MTMGRAYSSRPGLLASIIIAIGVLRIAATYPHFSQTIDESAHIGAGMEWLGRGTYRYEAMHPPLARVSEAIGPYLAGVRFHNSVDMWEEGQAVLDDGGHYLRNLTLARLGVLPYFVLAGLAVFFWGRHLFDPTTGLVAAACLTTLPMVLGHAGLATTDLPATAAFAWLLHAFTRWLERPLPVRGAWLGVAGAGALLTKFSLIPFFGLWALLTGIAYVAWGRREREAMRGQSRTVIASCAAVGVVAFVLVWAMYRFEVAPVHGLPFPARGLVDGIRAAAARNHGKDQGYMLGQIYDGAKWSYFPLALLVKTPISVLLLGAAGIVLVIRRGVLARDWRLIAIPAAIVSVLLVAMASALNIGARHILPLFPAWAVCVAVAFLWAWRHLQSPGRRVAFAAATALLSWSSVRTHPDYLAYFNEFVGDHPEHFLVASDLDWGQDLLRLRDVVEARRIPRIRVRVLTSVEPSKLIPNAIMWDPASEPLPPGWFAMSEYSYAFRGWHWDTTLRRATFDTAEYHMYDRRTPVARVGRSIRLYCIAPDSPGVATTCPLSPVPQR